MRTIDEYRSERPARQVRQVSPDAQVVMREAVRMEVLTHDENWNFWLSFLEAHLKATKRLAEGFNTRLRDPMVVNPDDVAKLRAGLALADERVRTLEEIITFPKLLIEQGDKAKKLIAEMQRDAA